MQWFYFVYMYSATSWYGDRESWCVLCCMHDCWQIILYQKVVDQSNCIFKWYNKQVKSNFTIGLLKYTSIDADFP